MDELTELIADAQAEEEVRAAQINSRIQKAKAEEKKTTTLVTIPLEEYNGLRDSYRDLTLVMSVLLKDLKKDGNKTAYIDRYDKEDEIISLLSLLYPNAREW